MAWEFQEKVFNFFTFFVVQRAFTTNLAAATVDCGFCPVIKFPSLSQRVDQGSPFTNLQPSSFNFDSNKNGTFSARPTSAKKYTSMF